MSLIAGMQATAGQPVPAAPVTTQANQAQATQDPAQSQEAPAQVSALSQAAANAGIPQASSGTPSTQGSEPTIAELQAQLATANERYSNLQSHHDKTRIGLQNQVTQLQQQAPTFVPPKTQEELSAFQAANPDWYGVIESVAHGIAQQSTQALTADLRQTQAREAAQQIQMAHPDCGVLFADPNFEAWAANQGPEVQGWLNEEHDASKVIRAITYFKQSQMASQGGYANQAQTNDISGFVNTGSIVGAPNTANQGYLYTSEQLGKMTQQEYETNYEAIQKAYAAGQVLINT